MSIPHPELPVGAFLALGALLVCLPSHIRARNVASASLNIWLCLICLISGVDTIVWANDMVVRLEVWCDISTKLIIGSNIAFPACAFCICRFLCEITKPNAVEQTPRVKRRRAWIEFVLCWVQPMVIMALHFIVQGHRFDVFEIIGCQPTFYVSWPALFIITIPPLAYCFGTFIYAGFAFFYFLQKRLHFEEGLLVRGTSMSTNRFLRLMILATAEMIWGTPWYLFVLVANFTEAPGVQPWVSWAWVHYDWYNVGQFPLSLFPQTEVNTRLALWWVVPASGYLFFIFFGFSEQALKDYRGFVRWIRVKIFKANPADLDESLRSARRAASRAHPEAGLPPRRKAKEETFEDFAKNYNLVLPPKVETQADTENPDTWNGWISKVAKEDAQEAAESGALPESTEGHSTYERETGPNTSASGLAVCCSCHLPLPPSPPGLSPEPSSHVQGPVEARSGVGV